MKKSASETNMVDDAPSDKAALLTSYKRISYDETSRELEALQQITKESLGEWHQEVSLYEQTLSNSDGAQQPRRNYANTDGKVFDSALFPYHDACYPLLDAFDTLSASFYDENVLFIRPTDRRAEEMIVPGQALCSTFAVQISVAGLKPLDDAEMVNNDWGNGLAKRLNSLHDPALYLRCDQADVDYAKQHHFGLAAFPQDADVRADLLLKLLRHALSDLQKDYLLARYSILRLAEWKLVQNVDCLRKVLSNIGTSIVNCDGHCFDRFWNGEDEMPDHSCQNWKSFESSISVLLATGIEYFTSDHAVVISSVARVSFDKLNPAAAELEASLIADAKNPGPSIRSANDKRKTLLKRNLFLSRNTDFESDEEEDEDDEGDSDEGTQRDWIEEVVIGLGIHATFARKRVQRIRDMLLQSNEERDCSASTGDLILVLRKCIDSFYNCVRCLVDIGECAMRRLPVNQRTAWFGSRLLLVLTQAFLEPNPDFMKHDRTYLNAGLSLIDPCRYADSILTATARYRERFFPGAVTEGIEDESLLAAIHEANALLQVPPDKDVTDVVHCLFAKYTIDVSISRCGYGDIQVWWGMPVSPLDPLLFFETCNIPRDNVLDVPWIIEANGQGLGGDKLSSRYSLSIILLLRAWHAPWTVASHHSYQKPIRRAVTTLLLCANRLKMPVDVAMHVSSFLRRDWWPDEQAVCWCEECLEKQATNMLMQKVLDRVAGAPRDSRPLKSFECCRGCQVAVYSSEAHRQANYRGGHKGMCGKPPYRLPGLEEEKLFREVMSLSPDMDAGLSEPTRRFLSSIGSHDDEDDLLADDDSGSWESVDSEERESDSHESLTDIVFRFFEKYSYKSQRENAARIAGGIT